VRCGFHVEQEVVMGESHTSFPKFDDPRERVRWARGVVGEVESLGPVEYTKFRNHAKASSFRREYFSAKLLTHFWTFLWHLVYRHARYHYFQPFHQGFCDWVDDWMLERNGVKVPCREGFAVVAREHCKTQIGAAYIAFRHVQDPGERIMIRSHKDPKAWDVLRAVKEILLSKPYQETFGWVRPAVVGTRRKQWTRESILLERQDFGITTASVETFGLGSDNTGGHFSGAMYDDWETRESAFSDELRPKLQELYSLDDNVMLGGSWRLTFGTPYGIDVYLDLAMKGKGPFKDRDYKLFVQSAFVEVLDRPLTGDNEVSLEVSLLDDRVTFRCPDAQFPNDLRLLPADITFFSKPAKDTVTERREVVWNDGSHFVVNRPIPAVLEQPMAFKIGTEIPACPNRFTQDGVDLDPQKIELDTRSPFLDSPLPRQSLKQKANIQGPLIFSCQMRLDPTKSGEQVLDLDKIVRFSEEGIPAGPKNWFRAVDLASKRKTRCSTSILTGFWHETGVYLMHLKYGNISVYDIILELLLGILRTKERWGGELLWTSFEDAAREEYLGEFLTMAERGPYEFFLQAGGKYMNFAIDYFTKVGVINVRRHSVSRGGHATKGLRIGSVQPLIEMGRLHVLDTIADWDEICSEGRAFRVSATEGFDIWDTIADLIREGYPPRSESPPNKRTYDFLRSNVQAIRRQAFLRRFGRTRSIR